MKRCDCCEQPLPSEDVTVLVEAVRDFFVVSLAGSPPKHCVKGDTVTVSADGNQNDIVIQFVRSANGPPAG